MCMDIFRIGLLTAHKKMTKKNGGNKPYKIVLCKWKDKKNFLYDVNTDSVIVI
jgi:hypothetical protein